MAVSIDLSMNKMAHAKRDIPAHLKSTVGGIVSFSDLGYCACTAKGGNTVQNLGSLLANYLVCTSPQVLSLLFTHHTLTDPPSGFKGLAMLAMVQLCTVFIRPSFLIWSGNKTTNGRLLTTSLLGQDCTHHNI